MPAVDFKYQYILPKDFTVKREKSCSITGHRRAYGTDITADRVKEEFIKLIERGYDTFLVGMAVGFDQFCFSILYQLKEEYQIKIVACIPCENQEGKFSEEQKKTYRDSILKADERVLVSKYYSVECMFKRNRFMVDNSTAIVCYLRKKSGGTKYTHDYAVKQGLEIICV